MRKLYNAFKLYCYETMNTCILNIKHGYHDKTKALHICCSNNYCYKYFTCNGDKKYIISVANIEQAVKQGKTHFSTDAAKQKLNIGK